LSGIRPEVSVVVPVRDDTRVDDLLATLAEQRGAPAYEVVIALDGSRRRPRVPAGLPARLLELPARGPYAARNSAAREAEGSILLFTDSDCLCQPDWIARAAREFEDRDLMVLQGGSLSKSRDRLSRYVQLEYERYAAGHAAGSFRRFCNTRNFGIRSAVFRSMPLPERFPRGGDGVYGIRLEAAGIPIRYEPAWTIEHRHPTTRWREGTRAFEEGRCGTLWKDAEGIDLFGSSSGAGPGAWLLRATRGSAAARQAASFLLMPVAAFFAVASAALPGSAGASAFHRFRRAAHLSGRLAPGRAG
jgi:glycosyl transferase family 2